MSGTVCRGGTLFNPPDAGVCVPGCLANSDCSDSTMVCSPCEQLCVPQGNANAHVGSGCTTDVQCPNGAFCSTSRQFPNGYCTFPCVLNAPASSVCSCPADSQCETIGRNATTMCVQVCTSADDVGVECRSGYVCQPQNSGLPVCLGKCTITTRNGTTTDSCATSGTTMACDVDSGICGGPPAYVDAGFDAGFDAGPPPAIDVTPLPSQLGNKVAGCGCGESDAAPFALVLLLAMVRRRSRGQW